jgi:hypothetical protein
MPLCPGTINIRAHIKPKYLFILELTTGTVLELFEKEFTIGSDFVSEIGVRKETSMDAITS